MRFGFKKTSLLLLAITAGVCSRLMFAFFHDPEGPNLLVVAWMAAVLFLISSVAYFLRAFPSLAGFKRISAAVFIQLFVVTGVYLGLR